MTLAVTFDCWNTLIYEDNWGDAHQLRVTAVLDACHEAGRDCSREEADQAFTAAWQRHMDLWGEGVATGAPEIARDALGALGLPRDGAVARHLADRFAHASHTSRVCEIDGARETLEALARAGVPTALICDTGLTPGRQVRSLLARLGMLAPLRAQVFSDEVGVPKPDARIFHEALASLGASADGSLHVGDLLRTDVAGGRAVGMTTVRLRARFDDPSRDAEADHVADSHADFRALLAELGFLPSP